jgi:hypothetical protein
MDCNDYRFFNLQSHPSSSKIIRGFSGDFSSDDKALECLDNGLIKFRASLPTKQQKLDRFFGES